MKIRIKNPTQIDGGVKVDGKTGEFYYRNSFRAPTVAEKGSEQWSALHATIMNSDALCMWEKEIPSFGCECAAKYGQIKIDNPPRFDDFARWGWELHNAVNEKLGKPFFTWDEFCKLYPANAFSAQPKITNLIAVTSLAPHRLERQSVCLDSWKKLGLEVVSVNSQSEINSMRDSYPQVSRWVSAEFQGTPRINSLIDIAASDDTAIIIINSDIEVYGNQSLLVDLVDKRKNAIGIRHNYANTPGVADAEPWGLDAFVVYPEQVASLSRVGYRIGKPMWDYWLAVELEAIADCEWIGEPYFYHKTHPVAWTGAECTAAHESHAAQFGAKDWAVWRKSKPFPPT